MLYFKLLYVLLMCFIALREILNLNGFGVAVQESDLEKYFSRLVNEHVVLVN